jgi:hypothetical protein
MTKALLDKLLAVDSQGLSQRLIGQQQRQAFLQFVEIRIKQPGVRRQAQGFPCIPTGIDDNGDLPLKGLKGA